MSLKENIAAHPFFAPESGRVIDEISVAEFMVNVKYHEPKADIPSSLIALRAPYRVEDAKLPAYVMSVSLGCVVKRNVETKKYSIKVASLGKDSEEVNLEYDLAVSEEEFFQQSLLHDFRSLTYDHVRLVDDMADIIAQFEKEQAEAKKESDQA